MRHVSSSDSINWRRGSSDSSKDSEGPGGPGAPVDLAGPRVGPERRGSGPGPAVVQRKSSDRRSCSSLPEKEAAEGLVSNGCFSRWACLLAKYHLDP